MTVQNSSGYRFIRGVFQYSAGVAAEPDFQIERVRFQQPVPLDRGFEAIQSHLRDLKRPLHALCACELRSPAQSTEERFRRFNQAYVQKLHELGLLLDGTNPIARTNVCPDINPPREPCFYAFSYTVPSSRSNDLATFVVSGSGEAPEGRENYKNHIVRRGDCSTDGLREKARWVVREIENRMNMLGFNWRDATGVHLYTVHDVHPFMAAELVTRGAAADAGLCWHYCRPPVSELDFEMDVRRVQREMVI